MTIVDERQRLLANIARLRRAERESPASEDLATVRTDLERALGPTVRRSVAARALGVSQTALDRWIAQGDIPAVITPTGRREVPAHVVVDLIGAVEERRRAGARHPLASVLRARRAEADRLSPEVVAPPRDRGSVAAGGHRAAELRSLAYHRAIAEQLDEDLVRDARERLRRWRSQGKIAPRYAERWEEVLSQPIERIAELLLADSEPARDLRQSSPFAGALSEPARRRILELVG